MIEYSIICMIASALVVTSPFVAIEIITAIVVKAQECRAKKELFLQQKQDKLAQKEYERILKQTKCKWDDKAECRQNRGCDYCTVINGLEKV